MQIALHQNHSNRRSKNLMFGHQSASRKADCDISHEDIRCAVRGWAASEGGQEAAAIMIVNAWKAQGGNGLNLPDDTARQKQKIFRWLDGDSPRYREYIRILTPAILDVLPVEFRNRVIAPDLKMLLVTTGMKETSEAIQAVAMDAPQHQKLKELSEGITSLFRLADPGLLAPLMDMVTMTLGIV
ncbi:hypothetical protein M976_02860 [Buttiauxella ferragutiae ATCC 51602]|uniref:Bacterial toxin YdaT domain-containing protein n=1 Tax=Buttiauxella ferragutiae ATCC 51602 TaxID=1354252 RepID=A0ABX2W6X9_9ENTR|nr:toxin YdaT family protein [Buttiauxella ferragutiae]OAT26699.1 hypothetical protein M976_02860 [Buttiauxella ferragutiae ATCC 51602]